MARAASAPKKEISMEEALWKSADKLRGSVEPAEYKHVVLSLFFLKFASDKFEAQRKAISEKYGEKFVDNVAFYTKDNVFFLPEISRWSFIMENAKQDDIALKIDTALYTIEKANPALKGALPDNYYSRLHIDTAKLASLLDEIDKINTGDKENDIELTEEDRAKVTSVYHAWQQEGYEETYQNVPEFCYSASFDEVAEKGFTLVPSRYIEFVNRDENIDFDTKMKTLQSELRDLLVAEEKSKADLLTVFKELGYEIEL